MINRSKRAIILGCSHACGAEMWHGVGTDLIPDPQEDYGLEHNFAAQISRALGYTPCNHALGGGSNDLIFRVWTDLCGDLTEHDLVIACWTGPNRTEVWHEDDGLWLQISPGTENFLQRTKDTLHLQGRTIPAMVSNHDLVVDYSKKWTLFTCDQSAINNKIKNILALNHWAQKLRIPVMNIDSFGPVDHQLVDEFDWPSRQSFLDYCLSKQFLSTPNGHYGLDAHTAFAQSLLADING